MKIPENIHLLQKTAKTMHYMLYKNYFHPLPRMDLADPYRKLTKLWYSCKNADWNSAEVLCQILPEKAIKIAQDYCNPNEIEFAITDLKEDQNQLFSAITIKNMDKIQECCEEFYISFLILHIEVLIAAATQTKDKKFLGIAQDYSNKLDLWMDSNLQLCKITE